ncbi:hypothetical protein BJ170DRAFT_582219 [Xylariales sp. AK1849]|nr:hypothetical protein BJ170DRAFT_582219 [Xylariales sp. AK1849]
MWSWTVERNGTPSEALTFSPQTPAPAAKPTGSNLLIRVSHAGLNPVDPHLMLTLPAWLPFRRRATPGFDFVGTVVGIGSSVPPQIKRLMSGSEVCGALGVRQIMFGTGSLAEYISVPAGLVALKPHGLDPVHGTGCGVAGQTAVLIMREAGDVSGQRVLVNGASGGVGSILVQVLKAKGAVVVGICSGKNKETVKKLGADEVVDYTAHEDLHAHLTDVFGNSQLDLIIDCAGDDLLFPKSPAYLQPNGRFLSIVGGKWNGVYPFFMHQLRPVSLGGTPRSYKLLGLSPSGDCAREAARWLEEGTIKDVLIDSEYEMKDVVQAYEKLITKRAIGKIVVKVQK